MSAKYFLDTNILVYSFDPTAPKKQKKSQQLIQNALTQYKGIISYQVVQEFLNVSTKKFASPLTHTEINLYLEQVLAPLCELYPSIELYQYALEIRRKTRFSFYDSLIVASAIKAGCTTLYSEDLNHGQVISGLTIKNPFKSE